MLSAVSSRVSLIDPEDVARVRVDARRRALTHAHVRRCRAFVALVDVDIDDITRVNTFVIARRTRRAIMTSRGVVAATDATPSTGSRPVVGGTGGGGVTARVKTHERRHE